MLRREPIVVHVDDVTATPCPCGQSRRILRQADGVACGIHATDLRDAAAHHHKRTTEVYYILSGEGEIEVGQRRYPVRPGHVVYIPAGSVHRAIGEMEALIVTVPPFDAEDEYVFDEQNNGCCS